MYPYPRSRFSLFAKWTAHATGDPLAFIFALATIAIWLVIRTAVWLQRHLAARHQHGHDDRHVPDGVPDSEHAEPRQRAMQLKLDELIRAVRARTTPCSTSRSSPRLTWTVCGARYESLGRAARDDLLRGLLDTDMRDFGHYPA